MFADLRIKILPPTESGLPDESTKRNLVKPELGTSYIKLMLVVYVPDSLSEYLFASLTYNFPAVKAGIAFKP